MDNCVELLLFCFGISGLIIFCSITFYILTSTYWEQHDFVRKTVRITSTFSQFCVFTIISCIVKRKLYYADGDRASDNFWRRLKSAICPIIPSDSIRSFLTKIEHQSNKDQKTKCSYTWQRYLSYGIVIILNLGEF